MKRRYLGLALAGTLIACYFAPTEPAGVIAPAAAHARAPVPEAPPLAPPAAAPTALASLGIQARTDDLEVGNPFAAASWQSGAGPVAKAAISALTKPRAAASAPLTAPLAPLPQFLGKYTEDGRTVYLLRVGEAELMARPGEALGPDHHFDSVQGDTLSFTYKPLNQKQSISTGDTN